MYRCETSWDDCTRDDLVVASLLSDYGLPGLFFVPTESTSPDRPRLSPGGIRQLATAFQIGGHTTTHPEDLKCLAYERQYREVADNKAWLEDLIGREIDSFAYPGGRYNETTISQVRRAGFSRARTTLVGYLGEPVNPYRWHPSVHVGVNRKEYHGDGWLEYGLRMVDSAREEGTTVHLWGHAWEIAKTNQWDSLEKLLAYARPS